MLLFPSSLALSFFPLSDNIDGLRMRKANRYLLYIFSFLATADIAVRASLGSTPTIVIVLAVLIAPKSDSDGDGYLAVNYLHYSVTVTVTEIEV